MSKSTVPVKDDPRKFKSQQLVTWLERGQRVNGVVVGSAMHSVDTERVTVARAEHVARRLSDGELVFISARNTIVMNVKNGESVLDLQPMEEPATVSDLPKPKRTRKAVIVRG